MVVASPAPAAEGSTELMSTKELVRGLYYVDRGPFLGRDVEQVRYYRTHWEMWRRNEDGSLSIERFDKKGPT